MRNQMKPHLLRWANNFSVFGIILVIMPNGKQYGCTICWEISDFRTGK